MSNHPNRDAAHVEAVRLVLRASEYVETRHRQLIEHLSPGGHLGKDISKYRLKEVARALDLIAGRLDQECQTPNGPSPETIAEYREQGRFAREVVASIMTDAERRAAPWIRQAEMYEGQLP